MLLLSRRPKDDADDFLDEDSVPLVLPEEALDASREEEETSLSSELAGALSIRDMAA
jgi:hypothetical protein